VGGIANCFQDLVLPTGGGYYALSGHAAAAALRRAAPFVKILRPFRAGWCVMLFMERALPIPMILHPFSAITEVSLERATSCSDEQCP